MIGSKMSYCQSITHRKPRFIVLNFLASMTEEAQVRQGVAMHGRNNQKSSKYNQMRRKGVKEWEEGKNRVQNSGGREGLFFPTTLTFIPTFLCTPPHDFSQKLGAQVTANLLLYLTKCWQTRSQTKQECQPP